ncbi:MAG: ribonuclease HII [Nitrospirae bacterium]|nr:ribonuclease HII [Nitrospirota bacterium]
MDIYQYDDFQKQENGIKTIAGIDEAGRGPIAGPVVSAAVILPQGKRFPGLRDSKLVPEKERETLFFEILAYSNAVGVGICDVDVIDRLNILRAVRLSMEIAVKDLGIKPDLLLIDAVRIPKVDIKQITPIKGESKSAHIAAASIIAKVVRDRCMYYYHNIYPEYGFDRHKGYCTKEHIRMIQIHGPCLIHRKTFKKVLSLTLPF